MSYYEEDFYQEPSEFEMQIEEFKESLMKSVKNDFIAEMERLKNENIELQSVKEDFKNIKKDYESKKFELERERNDLQRKVRRERLSDLLENHKIIMYKASSKREYPEKCDKCDTNRQVKYITPLGRKTSEDCSCKESKTVYFPQEFIRYEFRLNRNENDLTAWYKQYGDNEDGFTHESSIHADNIYSDDMKFKEIKTYSTFFKAVEECQGYCNYLNEQQK